MPGPGRPFVKGQPRPAGSGRAKGTPNRFSAELADAIAESFTRVGGADFLARLAESEPRAYVALLARVLPAQLAARTEVEHGGALVIRWADETASEPS